MKMEWRLPKDMRREIYFAETRISDLIRQHDVQALEYDTQVIVVVLVVVGGGRRRCRCCCLRAPNRSLTARQSPPTQPPTRWVDRLETTSPLKLPLLFLSVCSRLGCCVLCRFGKRFITQNKMSPDAFVQMAIVYGYYGLYGDVVAAYEPVLTKVGVFCVVVTHARCTFRAFHLSVCL